MGSCDDKAAGSEAQFRQTFERANVGIAHVSADGRFIRVNDSLCALLGRSGAEILAMTFQELTHPEDLTKDLELFDRLLAGSIDSYTLEKRYVRPDGSLIWGDLNVSLVRKSDGTPDYFISVVVDIQGRKDAQERVELVLGEVNHRIKNLITVINSIVKASARAAGSAQELEKTVSSRLMGIAASHDLLVGKGEAGSSLERLIRRQLEIFVDSPAERVIVSGPPVDISPSAVHAFGMVIHELATNACKYGALSNAQGIVRVAWGVDAAAGQLTFSWREEQGPPVAPPVHAGFGARTLERMLGGALGGTARHSLPPEGAAYEAVLPLGTVV